MTSSPSPRPEPRSVDQRWRDLGVRRRWHLVTGGGSPRNRDEAITMLGYARQMHHRSHLWAIATAMAAFAIVMALVLSLDGSLATDSLILAGGIGIGVGLGYELGGRIQARRLHRKAEAALAESETR
jgi:hypothetical protein